MTAKESLKKIHNKTYIIFFVIFSIAFIIFMILSFYQFSKHSIQPQYEENVYMLANNNLQNRYHSIYNISFIINNTLFLFFNNLFVISLIFFSFCYSLIIKKGDLITSDGKTISFAQIVSRGLYILIGLTIIYFFALEFFIPVIEKRLEWMKNKTSQAIISLEKANEYYYKKMNEKSLLLYQDYINIIEKDETIKTRIRELKNEIKTDIFNKNKMERISEKSDQDTTIADTITDYIQLAEIYFQKKDYHAAWYYYQYIIESDSAKRNEAKEKINLIKKIFKYENSMMDKKEKISDRQLQDWLSQKEREIQEIYILKNQAEYREKKKEYQKAFFIYKDILKKNPNLRDVIKAKNNVYLQLTNVAVELSDIECAKIYPSKRNFVFMLAPRTLIYISSIIKRLNKFYFYDVKIYNLDNKFKINSIIESPYGETKSPDSFTLYCYSLKNRKIENYPTITYSNSSKKRYSDYIFSLPVSMNTLYNFSYDYNKTLGFSLAKLFQLKNFTIKEKGANDFSIGFNNNFIKTAIADKISRIFIFFSICLILISLSWRFRSSYISNIPIFHYLLMLIIPFFIYVIVNILQTFITSFYSILSLTTNFAVMLIISFVLNIILMIFSIIYIASSK